MYCHVVHVRITTNQKQVMLAGRLFVIKTFVSTYRESLLNDVIFQSSICTRRLSQWLDLADRLIYFKILFLVLKDKEVYYCIHLNISADCYIAWTWSTTNQNQISVGWQAPLFLLNLVISTKRQTACYWILLNISGDCYIAWTTANQNKRSVGFSDFCVLVNAMLMSSIYWIRWWEIHL